MKRLARVILGTACFARLQLWAQEEAPREAWIKRIDLVRLKLGINPLLDQTDTDIQILGLDRVKLDAKELAYLLVD